MADEFCDVRFKYGFIGLVRCCGLLTQNEQIQRYIEKARELDKEIHGAASFASLNVAQKASVNIQRPCELFLCVTALYAELADALSALFYVISHCMASNLKFWGCDLRLEIMGISLCRSATAAYVPDNPTKNDKAERQEVYYTSWRSADLQNMYLSSFPA